jgi:hypothetical protein
MGAKPNPNCSRAWPAPTLTYLLMLRRFHSCRVAFRPPSPGLSGLQALVRNISYLNPAPLTLSKGQYNY